MNTIDNPFLASLGAYPPATVRLKMCSGNSGATPSGGLDPQSISVVPWQPGTPPGLLIPVQWQVTDIFFRVETPASAGNTTLTIQRSTGTGAFASVNNINDTPVVIAANAHEPATRPRRLIIRS